MANGDEAAARSHIHDGVNLTGVFIEKYKDEMDAELDRLGNKWNINMKPYAILAQYIVFLKMDDNRKYEDFKEALTARHPETINLFSFVESCSEQYYTCFMGV